MEALRDEDDAEDLALPNPSLLCLLANDSIGADVPTPAPATAAAAEGESGTVLEASCLASDTGL